MARYALVIGISRYDSFRNLDKAATDAEAIARILQTHGQYQVEPLPKRLVEAENCWELATDKKLTGKDLGQALATFLLERAKDQEALIYFAGHGFEMPGLGRKKKGYLATSDSVSDGRNAILFSDLNDLIRESNLSNLVLILDCCHAGSFLERTMLESTLTAFNEKKDYYLITSCRSFERAREGEEHGVFTSAVLKGLQRDNADSEGTVTGDRLFDFVQRELRQSGQEPIRTGTGRSITLVTYQPALALGASEQSEQSPAKQYQVLAQQMQSWFKALSYDFGSHEVWEESYFEWAIHVKSWRGYDRILVRGIEGETEIHHVQSFLQSVQAQRADGGWLVAARRVSPSARHYAEENRHIICYTFDELVDQEADFNSYFSWLEAEVKRQGIDKMYVPLGCIKDEIDPITKQKIVSSRYEEIDKYIDQWLADPSKKHVSVLGEFGTGKTWFALHYAWVALQQYQKEKERGKQRPRLPLVITLRDYAKALDVNHVVAGFFFTQHNIRLTGEVFDQLNRMGKLLLIFDGFDEMAAKVDKQQMINNFWELAKVVVAGAKVILTCRTEHFPEAQEGRAVLNAELQPSTANLTAEAPQFEVLELEKLDDDQIRQILSFQASPSTVEQVMGNPQLLDLARRPVMTDLILEALPEVEAGKPIDMSRIYLYAVRHKMERDISSERTFTSLADKLYFLCEVAQEMLATSKMSLNYRLFPERIRYLFDSVVREERDLDHWHYDMMGNTMLIRNAEGDYFPAHRSFLEFFVAYKFAAELGVLAPDFAELAQTQSYLDTTATPKNYTWSSYFKRQLDQTDQPILISPLNEFTTESFEHLKNTVGHIPLNKSQAILDLLVPMLDSTETTLHRLFDAIEATRGKTDTEAGYVGGNAVTLILKLDQAALENRDLSRTVIRSVDFTHASLRRVNFAEADLSDCTFTKNLGNVLSVVFSPDSNRFATADSNEAIRLWNAEDGREVLACKGHSGWIYSLVFSPDGKMLASGSYDRTIRLWDIDTGKCTNVLHGHTNSVWSVAFSSCGNLLVSGSNDRTVKLWDIHNGQCIRTLQGHTEQVRAVAFSPTGEMVASGGNDSTVRLWNIHNGECLNLLQGHVMRVNSITFSPDGEMIATGSFDQTIRLWDVKTGQHLRTLQGHTNKLRSIAFSPDGAMLTSGGEDCTVRLWDVETGQCLQALQGHTDSIWSVAFSHDGEMLSSGSFDKTVKLWNVRTGMCLNTLKGHTNSVCSVASNPLSDNIFASGNDDTTVKLWNTNTGQCLNILQGHSKRVWTVAFSSDGKKLASGSADSTVKLWDISSGECLNTLQGHSNSVWSIAFSSKVDRLSSGSDDHTVRIWDINSGECLNILQGHADAVWSVAFSPCGNRLVSGSNDQTVKIWDAISGECLQTLEGHTNSVRSVAFSPCGSRLFSGSSDQTVKLWDVNSGECLQILKGHTNSVRSVAFSPCGNRLISGSNDQTVKLWDISSGECLQTLEGHTSSVGSVTFCSDGITVISGSNDETIRIWDVQTSRCRETLRGSLFDGMNITGTKGLNSAQRTALKELGAVSH